LHRGYAVQYAHCIKEQGKYFEAEQHYRDAFGLGEVSSDLLQHLRFVTAKTGRSVKESTVAEIANFWLF
jgi:hypothetical protein